jgi:endonuclease YncB( thermonuclease family)
MKLNISYHAHHSLYLKAFSTALTISFLVLGDNSFAQQICARVKISDGDTLTCDGEKIRLCGIDAPERSQPFGQEAKQYLAKLLTGKTVTLTPVGTDRYGRTVAEVKTNGSDQTVNATMARAGMAYHYAQFSRLCPHRSQIIESERKAQIDKIGVWSGNFEKPWDYRKRNRSND